MCIADWRIGRLIRSSVRVVSVGATDTIIAAANRDRVAITFVNDSAGLIAIQPQTGVSNGQGFTLTGGSDSITTAQAVTTTGTLGPSALALNSANTLISANYTGTAGVMAEASTATVTGTGTVPTFSPYLHFTLKDYGDLPMQAWVGISFTGGDTITVIEYFLPESQLNLLLEQLDNPLGR